MTTLFISDLHLDPSRPAITDLFLRFLRTQQPKGPLPASLLSRALLDKFYDWTLRPSNGLHGRRRSLETARRIVEVAREHGGSLAYRSRPGHTVFTLLLPVPLEEEVEDDG